MRIMGYLGVSAEGADLVTGINGAPLLVQPWRESIGTELPLNAWLLPDGLNTVFVEASPAPKDDVPVDLRIGVSPAGEGLPGPFRFLWQHPARTGWKPFRIELPFVSDEKPKTKLFTEATAHPVLGAAQRQAAIAAGLALRQAFADQRVDRVVELCAYKFADLALAFEDTPENYTNDVRAELGRWLLDDEFALLPVDESKIELRPCAGGRAFHLSFERREFIVSKETSEKYETAMPVYVADVGGAWRVVR